MLRNDEQTDCSVLKITKVGAPNNKDVTISPIYDGRYLQLDASDASAGTVTFTYDISDGRGQTSSATVTVTLKGEGAGRVDIDAAVLEYDGFAGCDYRRAPDDGKAFNGLLLAVGQRFEGFGLGAAGISRRSTIPSDGRYP